MSTQITLPSLGEGVESADVVDILVAVGDMIEKDQAIIEAETDKASMEVPSTAAGKITEILVSSGDTVSVGQTLVVVDESASGQQSSSDTPAQKKTEKPKPAAQKQPEPEPQQQPSEEQKQQQQSEKEEQKSSSSPQINPTPATGESTKRVPVAAAPSVRQFAREIGVELSQVVGTGPGGRISINDVKNYARSVRSHSPASAQPSSTQGVEQRASMSKLRKVAAQRLSASWQSAPHVTLHSEVDITDLESVRQQFKAKVESSGGKLTITAMFLKIVASALKNFPLMNASIDSEKNEIIYKKFYNIGVAVDTPQGLVVPVIKDVDKKNIVELSLELTTISAKARDKKLTPDDMSGGTFTISNLGSLGVGHFTPIINQPEVGILGMGRAVYKPMYNGKEFIPQRALPLSISFDHRLIDGADGARFMKWIVDAVEQPLILSLEG